MTKDYTQELITKMKENYLSVALGVLVFLVAVTLIFRSGNTNVDKTPEEIKEETQKVRTYTVKKGESVSSIARDQLGSMDFTDELIATNNLRSPNQIEVGTVLVLPEVSEQDKAQEISKSPTATVKPTVMPQTITITGATYTVKKGDTLFIIAQRSYGDGYKYPTIVKANNLRNPDRIEVGTVLKIPRENSK